MGTYGSGLLRAIVGALRGWLETPTRERKTADATGELEVAVATLLAAIVRIGSARRQQAWAAAAQALSAQCRVDMTDAQALVAAARERAPGLTSYSPAVSVLNRQWSAAQKLRFTRQMWRVARADGRASFHQGRLVHRIAEELDVAYSDVLAARERVWFQ
jgi:uncharacterized tellurite resistance protein B-like protein